MRAFLGFYHYLLALPEPCFILLQFVCAMKRKRKNAFQVATLAVGSRRILALGAPLTCFRTHTHPLNLTDLLQKLKGSIFSCMKSAPWYCKY